MDYQSLWDKRTFASALMSIVLTLCASMSVCAARGEVHLHPSSASVLESHTVSPSTPSPN